MKLKKELEVRKAEKERKDSTPLFRLLPIFPRVPIKKSQNPNSRPGYLFIIIVMLTGVLALMATVSLLLLSWSAEQQAVRQAQSSQSLELARSCMDIAVLTVRSNPSNSVSEQTHTFTSGTCHIEASQGGGTGPRRLCTSGTAGGVTRRLTSTFTALYPKPVVSVYEEMAMTDICSITP